MYLLLFLKVYGEGLLCSTSLKRSHSASLKLLMDCSILSRWGYPKKGLGSPLLGPSSARDPIEEVNVEDVSVVLFVVNEPSETVSSRAQAISGDVTGSRKPFSSV